ncbi:glycosyltransferase [Spiribacter pallidus]|uniref:glycosyltransferase n=1 Tax=Spiribacter pallidus TaxID=1987936 RepID=UPI00349FF717
MTISAEAPLKVSVISHDQGAWLEGLVADLDALATPLALTITLNVPEALPGSIASRTDIRWRHNDRPQGFGANHNRAFEQGGGEWFAVLNPDLRLPSDPFPALQEAVDAAAVGVVAPRMLAPDGAFDDNARFFPSPMDLVRKAFGRHEGRVPITGDAPQAAGWLGGMFLFFPRAVFARLGGFDEGFHLYYEDVDLCARLWKRGYRVEVVPGATAVHHAQRASRRDLRYMGWHLRSIARYFYKHFGRLPEKPGSQAA